jgi:hypothetical protein
MKRQILCLTLMLLILFSACEIVITACIGSQAHPLCQSPVPSSTLTPNPSLSISITRALLVRGHPQYLEWDIANTGNTDVFIAPVALFFKPTSGNPGWVWLHNIADSGNTYGLADARNAYDSIGHKSIVFPGNSTNGGFNTIYALAGHNYRVFSGSVVPADAKWAVYNAFIWHAGGKRVPLYQNNTMHYATLR